jgi:hypothetical protein
VPTIFQHVLLKLGHAFRHLLQGVSLEGADWVLIT